MARLGILHSMRDTFLQTAIRASLRLMGRKSIGSLAKGIFTQLDGKDKAFIANLLAPDMALSMGIARPLASPHTHDVFHVTVEDLIHEYCKDQIAVPSTKTLDLGCGVQPRNPFQAEFVHGVDIRGNAGHHVISADLFNQPIPYGNDSFDFVTAYDFIEHVPRTACENGETRFPFIQLMDEIWRILKPGGLFLSHTPAYPSQQAFQDPTHVNIISEHTFPIYFCFRQNQPPLAGMYGLRSSFNLITQKWKNCHLVTLMAKPMPE